ncbi:MAG: glucose 1-dehydrogenase [Bacteroidales bacterium]|nr:glucose 1-dehydrogenase [Bacteroidales bacterium]MDT8432586.1 glucose 1-dehydrogenase [Bacteroidales bacterium]
MKRLEKKVVLVTGGSLGIGREGCRKLAQEGATVAITDIADEEGQELKQEIENEGGKAAYWHLDVSDEDAVQKVFSRVNEKFGSIDVLVNNAGISGVNKPTHEIELDEWQKVIAINVNGVFLCTKHVIPFMKKNGKGNIINMSSIYGIISAPDIPPYHASKGAVRLMTKTDAIQYAKDNIRVNSIHPGFIWTPLVRAMGEASEVGVEQFRKNLDALHPIGHIGEPEDIAWGIVFLASEESKFMTGTELVIDGGYTCK